MPDGEKRSSKSKSKSKSSKSESSKRHSGHRRSHSSSNKSHGHKRSSSTSKVNHNESNGGGRSSSSSLLSSAASTEATSSGSSRRKSTQVDGKSHKKHSHKRTQSYDARSSKKSKRNSGGNNGGGSGNELRISKSSFSLSSYGSIGSMGDFEPGRSSGSTGSSPSLRHRRVGSANGDSGRDSSSEKRKPKTLTIEPELGFSSTKRFATTASGSSSNYDDPELSPTSANTYHDQSLLDSWEEWDSGGGLRRKSASDGLKSSSSEVIGGTMSGMEMESDGELEGLLDEQVRGGSSLPSGKPKHNICMVSDFFYPNMGGVEAHLYQLAQCLIKMGHKVIIVTHCYDNRYGVRYLTGGLKVYYVSLQPFYRSVTLPMVFPFFPVFRQIVIREKITIVHGHQAFSSMCHEAILHASTMGIRTCFTDHSLFGFDDMSGFHANKVLKFSLSTINHVICVSNTSKENTVLRARLNPSDVSVIPNAVDASYFEPDVTKKDPEKITVVVMSRLVYRKGIDLLVDVIPIICENFPDVNFIIGGDGPMRAELEEMIDQCELYDRVEMLGAQSHSEVRDVLVRGHIFLNSSLTEAFCMAIVEAASCGLLVVSTRVGGVPEVLPANMLLLADPNAEALASKLAEAINRLHTVDTGTFHQQVAGFYNWDNVATRTATVYDRISESEELPLIERLRAYYGCGVVAGKLFCAVASVDFLIWRILEWLWPREEIEEAIDFDPEMEFEM